MSGSSQANPGGGAGPVKLGMCLCGGGVTGAFYEIGVLKALDEYLGPGSVRSLFDVWVGTSAGASVAGMLSQGVSPDRLYQAIWNPADPFFPLQRTDVFKLDSRRWLGSLAGVAWEVVRGSVLNSLRMPGTPRVDIQSAIEKQLPGGFFSLDGYRTFYEDSLRRNGLATSFLDLNRELLIPVVDVDTGGRRVFGTGTELETTPIAAAVAASSAIPGFFEPVRIGELACIDGGTGRSAHVDLAFERGVRSVVVVNPVVPVRLSRPHQNIMGSTEPVGSLTGRGLLKVWGQALRIGTSARVKLGLKRFAAEHPDVKVFLIEPPLDDATMFLFNAMDEGSRHTVLAHGYESTKRALAERGEALKELAQPVRARWLRAVGGEKASPGEPAGEFHVIACDEAEGTDRLAGTGW